MYIFYVPDTLDDGFDYLWGHLKTMVYDVKIQDINRLKECISTAITYASSPTVEDMY